MKLIRALLALYLLLSPMQGLAQVGPCRPDNTCASGQICLGPADTRYCYITCTSTDALGSSRECPERESCLQPVGFTQEVCVAGESISGGTPSFSGISTAIACNEARPCPTGQTCTDGTCRQRFGGPCTNDDNCPPGVRCVGDRTRTCGIAPSAGTTSGAPSTAEPTEAPFVPIVPTLGVSIPGLDFSVPSREGGIVRVNFIAEYINAAYRYLSAIGLVVAIVMVVYGGFIYLVGSAGMSSVQRGKKIIIDAIAGMLLILSAYSILNIINPATVNLTSLEFAFVQPYDDEEFMRLELESESTDTEETTAPSRGSSASASRSGRARFVTVDTSRLQRLDDTCIHMNTPVDPSLVEPLRAAANRFCQLRGSNTNWRIVGGGYRSPANQLRMWLKRCLNKANCTVTTGNPFEPGLAIRGAERRWTFSESSLIALIPPYQIEDYNDTQIQALYDLLLPRAGALSTAGHTQGLAVDLYCGGASRNQGTPFVPCQLILEQAMKESGFCRLPHESWHFELANNHPTPTCDANWTIGLVEVPVGENRTRRTFDYRSCTNFFSYNRARAGSPACY